MSSQKNQPLPNPFDTAINTGKIGGQGKQETDNTVHQQPLNTSDQQIGNTTISKIPKEEKSQSVDTKNQQPVKTAKKKTPPAGEKQPRSKMPTPAPKIEEAEMDEEDKTKLTCLISTDLFIQLKIYTAKRKKAKETMTSITTKALEEYMANHPN
jgi:hypothetical protein